MIYVSIDIETLGLDPKVHDIVEFGAVIDDLANPQPLYKLPRFHAFFEKENYFGNSFCMALHKRIWDAINKNEGNIIEIEDLMYGFSNFLAKNGVPFDEKKQKYVVNPAGKNFAGFDWQFLKEQIPADKWADVTFKHRAIDPGILFLRPDDTEVPGLEECLKRAGIPQEVTHDAIGDALQVVKLVRAGLLHII
jgi:oligoribonuclease (3'-5' exoribonuclease)